MESVECASLQTHGSSDFNDVASPVTGSASSSHGGLSPNIQKDSTVTHSVSYSTERDMSVGDHLRKPTSLDLTEQIRQLEIEGNKLRAATVSNLGSYNGFSLDANDIYEVPKVSTSNLAHLSTLVDISGDQKCISDLRVQLDNQRKETERLQKQLLGDMSSLRNISATSHLTNHNTTSSLGPNNSASSGPNISGSSNHFLHHSQSPGKSAFSTIPGSSELGSSLARKVYDYQPPSHLERSLKESQEQVMDLRKKLHEVTEASEQQKRQFRTTVEELKSKLHDTVLNRDTVLDLRQKESNSQEHLINKLQSSFTHLQEQYRAQEEALASASKKLDSYNQSSYMNETAISQVRSALVEREKRRGKTFFESEPASSQNVAMVAHTLERCLQELDHEVSIKSYKISELESDIEEVKKTSAERERNVAREYQEMLKKEADDTVKKVTMLSEEQERKVAAALETADIARQQLAALQAQIEENQATYQCDLKAKETELKDLGEKIDELKTDNMKTRAAWQEKLIEAKHEQVSSERLRQALETSLDAVQKELVETRTEKNELIRSQAALESRLEDLQTLSTRQASDLETERDRVQQQRQREEDLRSQVMNLELQVTNKQGDIERLERMLDVVKQECSVQVLDKVANAEKLERDRYLDQIKTLSAQLATMTEKCNKAVLDLQMARGEMENLRSQVHDLTGKLEKARSQMEAALLEKNDLTSVLGDKRGDLDRLHRDKDHYMQLAEQKSDEMCELKIAVDRLKIQLEEKEKVLNTFRQQSSSINQLMEVNSKANDNIREEREKLASALSEKSAILEEIKASQDSINRKLRAREKRIKDLEDERLSVTEELAVKSQELELMQQEKDAIFGELKESRLELSKVKTSKDALKKELARVRALRTKEINKLQTKLKETEQESRLSQKALRSKDMMDHKAVKFADKIQKEMTVKRSEMDVLLSKLHRLEEKLETVKQEKSLVEKDKDSLKKSLAKSLLHTQELTEELQTTQGQNRELVARVAQLEDEVEQATNKSVASHTKLEKYEQELATLKLKHQLDLKEAERLSGNRSGNSYSYLTGSSIPSSASAVLRKGPTSAGNSKDSGGDSSGLASDGCESDVPLTKNSLELRDEKHKNYSEVGKELKSLLSEMRTLISGEKEHQDNMVNFSSGHGQRESRRDKAKTDKNRGMFNSSPLRVQDLRIGDKPSEIKDRDVDRSWASKSFTGLGDVSDFSMYKEWRPRSRSQTRFPHSSFSDLDSTHGASFLSKGNYSDISRLSQSLGSPGKPRTRANDTMILVPDTQELCRRLEDKIDSLTRMGGNLVKENQEMADLISLQGEKLHTVKEIERRTREQR